MESLITLVFLLMTALADVGHGVEKSGLVGQSVKLPCPSDDLDQPLTVRWSDRVYASTSEPILIFRSENRTNFTMNSAHPNVKNFKVDRDNFALKISKLSYETSGEYACFGESGGKTFENHYYLTVYGGLNCSGETQLEEGQETNLTCRVKYGGKKPGLEWLREGRGVDSLDRSELTEEWGPVGEQELQLRATHDMDAVEYSCRMNFSDNSDTCRLRFNITYSVRNVEFVPKREEYFVGEEILCRAKGNPLPEISLVPATVDELPGDRVKSHLIIPKTWEGSKVMLACTANNTYQGRLESVRELITFQVKAATTTAATTTTTKTTLKSTDAGKPAGGAGNGAAEGTFSARTTAFLPFVAMVGLSTVVGLADRFPLRC